MDAGREMDVVIHMKVFGHPRNVPVMRDPGFLYRQTEAGWVKEFAPAYSTDIAAAWLVVEKCEYFNIERENKFVGTWQCDVVIDVRGGSASADTAPLAICRAALKAVEAE